MNNQENKPIGLKNDIIDDKDRWDLLHLEDIEEVVKILSFGSKKYGPNNWQYVENGVERYYAALMRHLCAWRKGENIDPDSGLHHLSHAACNILFLINLTRNEKK